MDGGGARPCPENVPDRDGVGHAGAPVPDIDVPETTELALEFNRAPKESEINPDAESDRHVAFMCYGLSIFDRNRERLDDVNIGGDDYAVVFGAGVHDCVRHDDESARFFGGPAARSELYFVSDRVEGAEEVQLRGWPVAEDLTAEIYFDEESTDSIAFDSGMATYSLSVTA